MIEKLTTDSDHNYIKENQFQENLFLLLKFLNLYCTCLKAYVHESFYYPLVMWGMRFLRSASLSHICWDDRRAIACFRDVRRFLRSASLSLICWDDERFLGRASLSLQGLLSMFLFHY
jgi:hypothetical protein